MRFFPSDVDRIDEFSCRMSTRKRFRRPGQQLFQAKDGLAVNDNRTGHLGRFAHIMVQHAPNSATAVKVVARLMQFPSGSTIMVPLSLHKIWSYFVTDYLADDLTGEAATSQESS